MLRFKVSGKFSFNPGMHLSPCKWLFTIIKDKKGGKNLLSI